MTGPVRANRVFTSTYTISNAGAGNGVSYTCTGGLNHSNATIIASDTRTGTGTIYVSSKSLIKYYNYY